MTFSKLSVTGQSSGQRTFWGENCITQVRTGSNLTFNKIKCNYKPHKKRNLSFITKLKTVIVGVSLLYKRIKTLCIRLHDTTMLWIIFLEQYGPLCFIYIYIYVINFLMFYALNSLLHDARVPLHFINTLRLQNAYMRILCNFTLHKTALFPWQPCFFFSSLFSSLSYAIHLDLSACYFYERTLCFTL